MKRYAALAVLSLGLVACAPESGEVVDRDYSPAWFTTSTSCTTSGNVRVCTPITTHYPESWSLRLDDGENRGWREVDPDEYGACHIGDHYPDCAGGGEAA
jgi:hypothetical protein